MNESFEWSLVRSFLAALNHGSLMGAARQLKVSQPTIGRHITELERQLGVELFERTGRGLAPTDMALRLAQAARTMELGAQQLAGQLVSSENDLAGTVRLSASQPIGCYVLPPLLAQMRQTLPDIQVELVVSNEVSNLLKREADIALRMLAPDQASVIARRVGSVKLTACAHQDYLRRRGMPKQLKDLHLHDLVGGGQSLPILKGLGEPAAPFKQAKFALRTDDLIASWQAIRAGLGVGVAAEYLVSTDPQVSPILPALKIPPMPMWLVAHREIRGNPRIRAVFNFLADAMPRSLT